jgi:hypothetical protein
MLTNPQSMLIPIYEDHNNSTVGSSDALIKTISTRIAGGRKEVSTEPSRVRPIPEYAYDKLRLLAGYS